VEPPLLHLGAEAKQLNWVEFFKLFQAPVGYDTDGLTIAVSGDVAFAYSLNRVCGTMKNGTSVNYWVRCTICFRKRDDNWVIAHDHVSVPVDPGSGKARLNLKP
jgi:ketosteroid isomerase-like protein